MSITIEHVSFSYRNAKRQALQDINFKIEKGTCWGLIGHNGAGKTSLLHLLAGLMKPSSGTITLFDTNYANHVSLIKNKIGFVPQEYALYPTLTCAQNLFYFGGCFGLNRNFLKTKIHHFLEELDILEYEDTLVKHCSGGIKRRVNIIACLLHNPDFILLDEPTVGVDIASKNLIWTYLAKLNLEGKTILITSHNLHEIEALCPNLLILHKGSLAFNGTKETFFNQHHEAKNLHEAFNIYQNE
ncbi:MAG: ABC transporter ATP-binding protein [Alphaproteobacteria bacterium]|nr:ABC transporter ATP-binding protein [Alphaproteobacteria bacterium]